MILFLKFVVQVVFVALVAFITTNVYLQAVNYPMHPDWIITLTAIGMGINAVASQIMTAIVWLAGGLNTIQFNTRTVIILGALLLLKMWWVLLNKFMFSTYRFTSTDSRGFTGFVFIASIILLVGSTALFFSLA